MERERTRIEQVCKEIIADKSGYFDTDILTKKAQIEGIEIKRVGNKELELSVIGGRTKFADKDIKIGERSFLDIYCERKDESIEKIRVDIAKDEARDRKLGINQPDKSQDNGPTR